MNITKRQKIIISATLLTIGLLSTQLVNFNLRFKFLAGLGFLSYILSIWSLWEGINRTKIIILLILPTFFTIAVASFYFLLPVRWLTRLPVATLFGLLFYLLLLAQNVFNVAAIRTIPLYRAASTAAFLFTLLSAFFIYNVIYSFNLLFLWNGLLIAVISFLLILQVLWSIQMEDRLSLSLLAQSAILSLVLGELALVFSFWPMVNPVWSLALATSLYVVLGISVDYIHGRLRTVVLADYLFIGFIIISMTYFLTSWTGGQRMTLLQIVGVFAFTIIIYVILIRRNIKDRLIENLRKVREGK